MAVVLRSWWDDTFFAFFEGIIGGMNAIFGFIAAMWILNHLV